MGVVGHGEIRGEERGGGPGMAFEALGEGLCGFGGCSGEEFGELGSFGGVHGWDVIRRHFLFRRTSPRTILSMLHSQEKDEGRLTFVPAST